MNKKLKKLLAFCMTGIVITTSVVGQSISVATVYAKESVTEELQAEIEASLYDFEYYCMANEDVAVALNYDKDKMYEHWLNFGMAEGRNASMVFNAKYYLEVNPSVQAAVGTDYIAAYEHFVTTGLLAGLESSPVFDVKYYLEANQDVAEVFGNDYVKAANHFNSNALAEGRSGSGNFDYTVYKDCNTDVAELYGNDKKGYYIHYINHGRAEGRTAGLGTSGDSGNDNTGGSTQIDTNAVSYRIFDASFYLDRYPELKQTVGTDENALYLYWIEEGIDKGQTASPVIVPEEYLELNQDVAQVFGNDKAGALNHFLNDGILEGRTGSYEFDYSIYAYCNTDVGDVFAEDKVGYYFHYVKYGKAENRTAATYIPPSEPEVIPTPTATSTPTPTATSTPTPTATSTPTPTATSTPKPTATSTPTPTATSTPKPTATSTPKPTATSTPKPTATSTPKPTATSTPKPTATSTPKPTATSTPTPTATSTPTPTPISIEERIDQLNISDLWKQELYCAKELGIPMDKVQQETLSGAEMMELLDWFVAYASPKNLSQWEEKYPLWRNHTDNLRRMDAMALIFLAADMIGSGYMEHKAYIVDFMGSINHTWNEECATTDYLFGEAAERSDYFCGEFGVHGLCVAALYYNVARTSNFSSQCPVVFDAESNSFQFSTPLTYADGILAIVRLISSEDARLFGYGVPEEGKQYIAMAEQRKEEIRNTVTDISSEITGTTYYISNNGSDENDGRSPETAWATPYRALSANLNEGDGVLFERGGTWYISVKENMEETSLISTHIYPKGVLVGAYGEGAKPVLRGDIERANDASFWELYYEKEGVKIWKASEQLKDSAVIVFNEGETYAEEVFPWISEDFEYMNPDGTPFVIEEALDKDLTFCNLFPDEVAEGRFVSRNLEELGELYLRCDAGNPAEVYEVVSVPQEMSGLEAQSAYDLSVFYFTLGGVGASVNDVTDYDYGNLEVGWCGGWMQGYAYQPIIGNWDIYGYRPSSSGGGIGSYGSNMELSGCYVHHCGAMAMIGSLHDHFIDDGENARVDYKQISGNLYEYSGPALHWTDLTFMEVPGSRAFMSNVVFEDNIVIHSGEGWVYNTIAQCNDPYNGWISAVDNDLGACHNDGIYIRNNIFYQGVYALFSLVDYLREDGEKVNVEPIFSGNTYVQSALRPLLQKNKNYEGEKICYPSEEVVTDVLGDETGTLIIIN